MTPTKRMERSQMSTTVLAQVHQGQNDRERLLASMFRKQKELVYHQMHLLRAQHRLQALLRGTYTSNQMLSTPSTPLEQVTSSSQKGGEHDGADADRCAVHLTPNYLLVHHLRRL